MSATAPIRDPLDCSLKVKLSTDLKREIVRARWSHGAQFDPHEDIQLPNYFAAYLNYYEVNRREFTEHYPELASQVTHRAVANSIDILSANRNRTREEFRTLIFTSTPDSFLECLELSMRCWLMLNVRSDGRHITGGLTHHFWPRETTLEMFIKTCLPLGTENGPEGNEVVDTRFNAKNLAKKARFRISWNPNLSDHLNFDRYKRRVEVFCCSSYLINNVRELESDSNSLKAPPYTIKMMRETLQTIQLLFPAQDIECKEYLKGHKRRDSLVDETMDLAWPINIDGSCFIKDYETWGKRLKLLYDEFHNEEQSPRSCMQLFTDNRNKQAYWAFIIAVVVFILTVISTAATIISTVTGVMQVKIALQKSSNQTV